MLGGTFDHLHVGHRALLEAAFRGARRVAIGLTTDRYVARHPKPFAERTQSYDIRRRHLRRFLRERFAGREWSLEPLEDGLGGSVLPGPDLIVVSRSTRVGAEAVNRERKRRGMPPLEIRVVALVRGEDGFPVSSRRIRAGLLRPDGRRRRKVHRASGGPRARGNVPPGHLP